MTEPQETKGYLVLHNGRSVGVFIDKAHARLISEGLFGASVTEVRIDPYADKLSQGQRVWEFILSTHSSSAQVVGLQDRRMIDKLPWVRLLTPTDGRHYRVTLWATTQTEAEAQARELLAAHLQREGEA